MSLRELEKKLKKEIIFRSCWECNFSHDYLKEDRENVYCCLWCGRLFTKGQFIEYKYNKRGKVKKV